MFHVYILGIVHGDDFLICGFRFKQMITYVNYWLSWIAQLWNACFNNPILAIPIYLVLFNAISIIIDKTKKLLK